MFEKVAKEGLTEIAKGLESVGINVGKGLNHNKSLESVGINISNSLIVGFSVLTIGILTSSVLHGINKLQIGHTNQKYGKEVDKNANLKKTIQQFLIYWWGYASIYTTKIATIVFVSSRYFINKVLIKNPKN